MIIGEDIRAFISAQRVARLATVDRSDRPHVIPIFFALDGDILFSVIDEKPKRGEYASLVRLRNIDSNPAVQVLIDLYDDDDWSRLRYVQLRGSARVITVGDEHVRAVALLRARYPQYQRMSLHSRPVIAVDVSRVINWQAG